MQLYLVRHATAVERSAALDDELRHLTTKGRKQATRQGRRLRKLGVQPDLIVTSPLLRAVQTAELITAGLDTEIPVTAHPCLLPGATAEAVIELLRATGKRKQVMLVGHEPHLSQLGALLLGCVQIAPLQKASCLALSWKPAQADKPARLEWYASNSEKPVTTKRTPCSRSV